MITLEIISLLIGTFISGLVLNDHVVLAVILSPSILGLWELAHIPVSNKDAPKNVISMILIAFIELLFSWLVGWLYIPIILLKLVAPLINNSEPG